MMGKYINFTPYILNPTFMNMYKTTTITSIKSWQCGNKTTKASADTKHIISCTQYLIINNIFKSAIEIFAVYIRMMNF
jgi:hypothetical protein